MTSLSLLAGRTEISQGLERTSNRLLKFYSSILYWKAIKINNVQK